MVDMSTGPDTGSVDGGPDGGGSVDGGDCIPTDPSENVCGDRVDNDCDGLIDYLDPDCQDLEGVCEEDCLNGDDDDGDGRADCADVECRDFGTCGNRMFVTRGRFAAGAVAGADELCQSQASAEGLGDASAQAIVGHHESSQFNWIDDREVPCDLPQRIYCVDPR